MSKSEKSKPSSEPTQNQILGHDPEVLKYLEPDAKTCDFQAHALDLAHHGLSTHPLKTGDKIPILKGWKHQATTDPSIIEKWGQDYPEANVGIATGQPSDSIIVDCDLRNGARESLERLKRKYGEFPITWTAITPGGWHFYFRHPGGRVRSYNSLGAGIEIKGEGGNIVAPGSIHPSGLSYQWQPSCSPGEVPLAPVPQWLLEVLKRKGKWTAPGEVRPEASPVNILGHPGVLGQGSGIADSLSGADVLSYFAQESVIIKILPLLGLGGIEIGEKFHCVLHPEERESASILRPEDPANPFMYMDFHERDADGRKAFALPLVYYWVKMQQAGMTPLSKLPKPTFLVWALRLLRDAGVIEGVKVDAPQLPKGVKAHVRRVYEGFWDLLSLKYLVEKEASPFTWGFGESWVGVSRKTVGKGMRWLLSAGFIRFVKTFGTEEAGNRVQLFMLGTRQLVQRLSGRAMLERGGQTEIIKLVNVETEALLRENAAAEAKKAASKLCRKCGDVWEWFTFGDFLTCSHCFEPLDTS